MSERERFLELGHFLRDRRARVSPAEAGLTLTPRRRVRGLRREEVAALAGIGVSWYTALEHGSAHGVSTATLLAIADVLRLNESEREYVYALARESGSVVRAEPDALLIETLHALAFPAYIITPEWEAIACNAAFRRVWVLGAKDVPCNVLERLFLDVRARRMHGEHFIANITPVVAMLRSGLGRRPELDALQRLRDRLLADDELRAIWDTYEISSPFTPTTCTIESPIGTFTYRTLDLPVPDFTHGIVVHVPVGPSRDLIFAS